MQGAELDVLRGSIGSLRSIKALFVEVSVYHSFYESSGLFIDINDFLCGHGFVCTQLCTDPRTGMGNALYVRPDLIIS